MKRYIVKIEDKNVQQDFEMWVLKRKGISIELDDTYTNNNNSDPITTIKERLIEIGYKYTHRNEEVLECWIEGEWDWNIVTIDFQHRSIHIYKDMDCGGYRGQKDIEMNDEWLVDLVSFLDKYDEEIAPLFDQSFPY